MVSREKGSAAAFQAPPEMPFPAFYGGCLGADLSDCVYSTAYGRFRSWGCSRMLSVSLLLPHIGSCGKIGGKGGSGCPCFSFAAAAVSRERCQAPSNCQGAAVKRERRCVRKGPGLSLVSRADTGGKALDDHRAKTPVIRAGKGVPGKARNAAASAFSSTPSKGASSFRRNQQGSPAATRRSGCGGEEEGQRSGMRDALPRRASRIWRSLTRRRMGVLKLPGFPGTPVFTEQTPLF